MAAADVKAPVAPMPQIPAVGNGAGSNGNVGYGAEGEAPLDQGKLPRALDVRMMASQAQAACVVGMTV